ncbi:Plant transposon protein [Fragilaria crotonensis]|nr:Plant transposon protein [Fragilaria crotonensis]
MDIWNDGDDEDAFADLLLGIISDAREVRQRNAEDQGVPREIGPPSSGGSRKGKAPNVDRRRVFYSHLLFKDYWGESPVYSSDYFRRFFKLPIGLFDEIVEKVVIHDDYFRQKIDAAGRIGLTPLQKICSAVRQLTSGVSSQEHDDKYRMAASTGLEAMKRFCNAVVSVYSVSALRHPNIEDINSQ